MPFVVNGFCSRTPAHTCRDRWARVLGWMPQFVEQGETIDRASFGDVIPTSEREEEPAFLRCSASPLRTASCQQLALHEAAGNSRVVCCVGRTFLSDTTNDCPRLPPRSCGHRVNVEFLLLPHLPESHRLPHVPEEHLPIAQRFSAGKGQQNEEKSRWDGCHGPKTRLSPLRGPSCPSW